MQMEKRKKNSLAEIVGHLMYVIIYLNLNYSWLFLSKRRIKVIMSMKVLEALISKY